MINSHRNCDVVVVGGGHAGIEAAMASAHIGCETLLMTMNSDALGRMSCNPAVGGLGKSQLVREVAALGGQMAAMTDASGLQFRVLNSGKGPAVRSTRAQCDKSEYHLIANLTCEMHLRLQLVQDQTIDILHPNGAAVGVRTSGGAEYHARAVVITTGTFLNGVVHLGLESNQCGRAGESRSSLLSRSLCELGLNLGRLKTGTPPRIAGYGVNWDVMGMQFGDEPPPCFSYWRDDSFHVERSHLDVSQASNEQLKPHQLIQRVGHQIPCHLTHTTKRTIELIRQNLARSPAYAGRIKGVGPRHCPSIEDKVVRFPDKIEHQIFLEPEGMHTDEVYVNGLSTSLPYDAQVELIKTVVGCENARVARPAYAVEYDFVHPTQLLPTLETKVCTGLFLAGQINGTSGYEEAAAQGLIAGINAARYAKSLPSIIIRRDQAYVGVLIDDLVTKGVTEPYRISTSRCEYRLLFRQDNADLRLAQLGHHVGLVSERNWRSVQAKQDAISTELLRLQTTRHGGQSLAHILSRPEVKYRDLPSRNDTLCPDVIEQVEIEVKYAGYFVRQRAEIERMRSWKDKRLPECLDYAAIPSLRTEARQKLGKVRPATLGQASRISGVSPADISALMVWLKRAGDASRPEATSPTAAPETEDSEC